MYEEEFTSQLLAEVDAEFERIMRTKPADPKTKFLNDADIVEISSCVRNFFIARIGKIPKQIDFTLHLSEAMMSSSVPDKMDKILKAKELAEGVKDIAKILASIAKALKWNPAMIIVVTKFFHKIPKAPIPPVRYILIGIDVTLALISIYFSFFGNNPVKNTKKYMG